MHPVSQKVLDVKSGYALLMQEVNGMTVFFAKYSQQTVGTVHYLAAARLDVKNGALNDPLETQRRERALLRLIGQYWCVLVDENADAGLELIEIRIACEQRFFCRRLIQQTDEKMLDGY